MKIGDLVLNMDMDFINEKLKNISGDELNKMKARTTATAFIVDMISEMIEIPSLEKENLSISEMGYFSAEVIAGAAAIATYRYSNRTDDPDAYLNYFKHMYETTIINMRNIISDSKKVF